LLSDTNRVGAYPWVLLTVLRTLAVKSKRLAEFLTNESKNVQSGGKQSAPIDWKPGLSRFRAQHHTYKHRMTPYKDAPALAVIGFSFRRPGSIGEMLCGSNL
jgi:hypothetical protein